MKNRGFTIIELIVVIVIMGILSLIAIPSFHGLFAGGRLAEARNEIFAFYQRVNRYATNSGVDYKLQVDGTKETMKCMQGGLSAMVKDSIVLRSGLDLQGGVITFTVKPDGFVADDDDIRTFSVYDDGTKRLLSFYISPLGVMEAK